jgi:O-antigen ligase
MRNIKESWRDTSWQFWLLAIFVILTFITGGSARGDVQSLIVLRPVAIVLCAISLWTIKLEQIKKYRLFFGFFVLSFTIVCLQLVPLPYSIWAMLPGREILTEIDQAAALGHVWRPISFVPEMTWNALFSMFIPLAILLLGAQLREREKIRLLIVVASIGVMSGLTGIVQIAGDPTGPLYFYRNTNEASAVGFFANRNHQAILLATLFPIFVVIASRQTVAVEQKRLQIIFALGICIVIIPLLLVTGSRIGLATGLVGLVSIPFLYRRTGLRTSKLAVKSSLQMKIATGTGIAFITGFIFIFFSKAQAIERLFTSDENQFLRFKVWGPIAEQSWHYFPFGAGAGTFAPVYQIQEKTDLLYPVFINHAHNDYLEAYFNFGFGGLLLASLLIASLLIASIKVWRRSSNEDKTVIYGKMASIILLIIAIGSISDYPLRIPSLMALATLACIWLSDALSSFPAVRTSRSEK